MTTQAAYDRWSTSYDHDRNLTRDLDRAVTQEILADLRFGSILEIGCGTGKNTAFLAGIAARVLALDFSQGMLAEARNKVRAANVAFDQADLTLPWPCASHSVDLVVCNLVLEHVADLGFVFAEAARCLVGGGRLFVAELHPFRQYQGAQARFEGAEGATAIPAFVHHLSDFAAAAEASRLSLEMLKEWWHEDDRGQAPRLVSFLFRAADDAAVTREQPHVWAGRQTRHGLAADEVISALQKEIRRGHAENAALLAYEMLTTGEELEAKLWQRLQVISVEDVGYGQIDAPVLVRTLYEMHLGLPRPQGDRYLLALHAVRYLCGCMKDRSSDEMLGWVKHAVEEQGQIPLIPDYALDMHTAAGRRRGRGRAHFLEEGALVSPELPDRDQTYRRRLLALLPSDEP